MSSLKFAEKEKLEGMLAMGNGYVLDFSDASFASFFRDFSVDIDDPKYAVGRKSASKANRLRGFWEQEPDDLVGQILIGLIELAEYKLSMVLQGENLTPHGDKTLDECKQIAARLSGQKAPSQSATDKDSFLAQDFSKVEWGKLSIEGSVAENLKTRMTEVQACMNNKAHLAAIVLAGSILEGLLLGLASDDPERFNRSASCPKDEHGKPRQFFEWSLAQFIDVAKNIGILDADVSKFSHALRDFRNYIHPHHQLAQGFNPDEDTAKICVQVVLAAFNDVAK